MSDKPYPTEARRQPETRTLDLVWTDGHAAAYAYDYLRGYCPCAECQGHAAPTIEFHQPARSVEPVNIVPVGNYAISFHWSDGHATGIYRFEFLRQICPCEACRSARGEEEAPGTAPKEPPQEAPA